MDTLYTELKDYIYRYCEGLMTEDEVVAKKTVLYHFPSMESESMLKERIVNRLWKEHQLELPLNYCPACHKIARTPKARQCRFCFHHWH